MSGVFEHGEPEMNKLLISCMKKDNKNRMANTL